MNKNAFITKGVKSVTLCLLFICVLSSCVNYTQSISRKGGWYNYYYRVTVSKVLVDLLYKKDADALFEPLTNSLLDGAIVKDIDTKNERGKEVTLSIKARTRNKSEKAALPKLSRGVVKIPFLPDTNKNTIKSIAQNRDKKAQALAKVLFGEPKCQIIIDKSVLKNISAAYFKGDPNDCPVPFSDCTDGYCLEIPILKILEGDGYDTSYIIIKT